MWALMDLTTTIDFFSRMCIMQLDCQFYVQVERLIYEFDGKLRIHL